MPIVNMLEAKSTLSRLVESVESGAVAEIIIARNGKPAARLVPVSVAAHAKRIGAAEGLFDTPEPNADLDRKAAALFRKFKK